MKKKTRLRGILSVIVMSLVMTGIPVFAFAEEDTHVYALVCGDCGKKFYNEEDWYDICVEPELELSNTNPDAWKEKHPYGIYWVPQLGGNEYSAFYNYSVGFYDPDSSFLDLVQELTAVYSIGDKNDDDYDRTADVYTTANGILTPILVADSVEQTVSTYGNSFYVFTYEKSDGSMVGRYLFDVDTSKNQIIITDADYYDEEDVYKITYNANGGVLDITGFTSVRVIGDKMSHFDVTASKAGSFFDGWYTSADGGTRVTEDTAVTNNMVLYAHWRTMEDVTLTIYPRNNTTPESYEYIPELNVSGAWFVQNVPVPEWTDHTFLGWYLGPNDSDEAYAYFIPYTENATLYAHWKDGIDPIITYHIGDNTETRQSDTVDYEYYGADIAFDGWYDSPSYTNKVELGTTVTEDTELWAKLRYVIELDFETNCPDEDEDAFLPREVEKNKPLSVSMDSLPTPVWDGHTFNGWFDAEENGNPVTMDSVFTEDTTIYAYWDQQDVTVTLNTKGGTMSEPSTITVRSGTALGELPEPEKEHYMFLGWAIDEAGEWIVDEEYAPTENTTLYAVWEPESYTVEYDADGGSVDSSFTLVEALTKVGELPVPTKDDYIFGGWFMDDGTELTPDTIIEKNITVTAKWTQVGHTCILTFDPNGGEVSETSRSLTAGDELGSFPTPTRSGYSFDGWYTDAEGSVQASEDDEILEDTTLYAHWSQFYVLFDPNGGVLSGESTKYPNANGVVTDLPTPEKYDNNFAGWYTAATGGEEFTSSTPVTKIMTVYAHWVPQDHTVTVTFDANGGQVSETNRDMEDGTVYSTLPTPTRNGYDFLGWYLERDGGYQVREDSYVEGDTTLYAHWDQHVVLFDGNGGTVNGEDEIAPDASGHVTSLPSAARDGYDFLGWFTDPNGGSEFTSSTNVTETIVVYAHWQELEKSATITFDANGGSVTETERTVGLNKVIGTLPDPTRDDYTFMGWYTEPDGGSRIDDGVLVIRDTTYYAHWKKVTHPVETLTLNKSELDIMFGDDLGLEYTYSPANADNAEFYWTSSDESVIRVMGDGTLQQVGGGKTTLTIHTVDNSKAASCDVTVTKPRVLVTEMSFDEDEQIVVIGDSLNMIMRYSPADAENATFVWESSDPSIVYVSEDGDIFGYGGSTGTTTITVSTADGTVSTTCTITVKPKDETRPVDPEELKHTIVFNTDGGTQCVTQIVKDGDAVDMPTTTKEGYNFLGWFKANGEKVESLVPVTDMTLYAHWERATADTETYVVTYDPQNGKAVMRVPYTEGSELGTMPVVSYDGYTFLGWYSRATGGTLVPETDKVNGDRTIYAQWKANEEGKGYKLLLNPNGGYIMGSGSLFEAGQVENGAETLNDISSIGISRNGYTFLGWFDAKNGGNMVYDAEGKCVNGTLWNGGKFQGTSDTVVYAHWEKNPQKYTLTFDTRGGNAIASVSYESDAEVNSFPEATYAGYDFLGWYDAPTGGSKVTSIKMDANKTIYAQYKIKEAEPVEESYMVTFDSQGGSEAASVVVKAGDEAVLPETTRDGYEFLGWFTEKENGTKVERLIPNADVTLYAHWAEPEEPVVVEYTVRFDDRFGSITTMTVPSGTEVGEFEDASHKGYKFLGWYTNANGGTLVESLTVDDDLTLYAHWEKEDTTPEVITYTATFDANGGENVESISGNAGTKVSLPATSREGYIFQGWYTAKDGGEKVTSLTLRKDVTLYAHWEKEEDPQPEYVTVWFDAQNGTIVSSKIVKGETLTDFSEPVSEDYEFLGWFTKASGGEKVESYNGTSNVTLYAHWEKKADETPVSVTLTFDTQGGDEIAPQSVISGTKITTFPEATRSGYTFLGWYTAANGGGKVKSVTMRADATVYAHWRAEGKAVYTVKLDENYSGGSVTSYKKEEGTSFTEFKALSRSGYTFLGWFTAKDGGSQVTSYDVTADAIFYAHWEKTSGTGTGGGSTSSSETKVSYIKLEQKEQTVQVGDAINAKFTWGPNGATNALFTWKSSDENVLKPVKSSDGTWSFKYMGYGSATLTVSTEDGSVSDSMKVTVVRKDGTTGDNSGSNGTGADSDTNGSNGSTGTNSTTNTDNESSVKRLTLTVVSSTGKSQSVQVNDNVLLSDLVAKLGINAASYTVKTYKNDTVRTLDASSTIKDVAALTSEGDVLIAGYDSAGQLVGSAKISRTGELTYIVTMSKNADQVLEPATYTGSEDSNPSSGNGSEAGKGESESSNPVSNEGKTDQVAQETKTGDINVLPLLVVGLGAVAALIAVWVYLKKRKKTAK